MELTESKEDYLETIYQICKEEKVARVKSIAKQLNVSLASVNYAVNILTEAGLLKHKKYGYIELTESGGKIGREILRKHHIIRDFLINGLGVDEKTADEEACRIEHDISNHTLGRIISFMKSKNKKRKSR